MTDSPPIALRAVRYPSRLALAVVIAAHVAMALAWRTFLPRGFPVGHLIWWANSALPWLAVGVGLTGLVCLVFSRGRAAATVLCFFAWFWIGIAIIAPFVFPQSARLIVLAPLAVGGIILRNGQRQLRQSGKGYWPALLLVGVPALVCAGFTVLAQRGPDSDTRPLNVSPPGRAESTWTERDRSLRLGSGTYVSPEGGEVNIYLGAFSLTVEPRLRFISCSPDRCWTSLASERQRVPHWPVPTGINQSAESVEVWYDRSSNDALIVRSLPKGLYDITTYTHVPEEVYSHLNSFCRICISGHKKLTVSFSPCENRPIEVLPSDYPIGRPARAACWDAEGRFRVVQASSGEKGPFSILAEGRLARGDAFAMTFQ